MTDNVEIIESNLEEYPFIKKFLGKIIKKRVEIECFTHGMLTANLLDRCCKPDLEGLECVLKLGESYCRDFKRIFQGRGLSKQSQIADGQIVDMLAEVKAFEFLYNQGFKNISSIRRTATTKTVDFTSQKGKENYAIEVTRLGLAQSTEKQPVQAYKVDTLTYETCGDADGYRSTCKTEGLNVPRLAREISDAINNKYVQIKDFCQREEDKWKVILFISSGRDYFPMRKYENKEYEDTPDSDFRTAITDICRELGNQVSYLDYIVITRGKDLGKAIVYPKSDLEE